MKIEERMHLDAEVFEEIHDTVKAAARQRHASGFLIVAAPKDDKEYSDYNFGVAYFALVNRDNVLRIGVKGKKDANFAAIAGAKFGKVLAHKKNSGKKSKFFGEHDFMGGRISRGKRFIYVFSGARQEVDDSLMKIAEQAHRKFFAKK